MSLAVVYSDKYLIDLAGLEKLHPYDTQKYRRIYQQLIKDGLLNEKNVFAPRPLDDDAILRVHTPEFLVSLKSPRMVAAFLEAPLMAALPGVEWEIVFVDAESADEDDGKDDLF